MRRIVVTGANKGIGLAIVQAILAEHDDTEVWLGSRNDERGQAAIDGLLETQPDWAGRLHRLTIDVSDDASVGAAVEAVGEGPLYGLVNNAGIMGGDNSLADVLAVNTYGLRRVTEAFLPRIQDGGRIVNVTSAAGPNFVSSSPEAERAFFVDRSATWEQLDARLQKAIVDDVGNAYGLSKAAANLYTLIVAGAHGRVSINACTPGFIATDMTRGYLQGRTPAEAGMKTTADGARCPLHLLFGEVEGTGRYYGSDAVRSPFDRYRSPGDPPHTGDP